MVDEKNIELATLADYDELLSLLDKANLYALDRSGEPMWTAMQFVYNQVRSYIEAGYCYIIRDRQKIMATMTITDKDEFWKDSGSEDEALYIHKLMKNPESSVKNVGLVFLSFAAHETLRHKRKFIRCDTVPTQVRLINYYKKLGFIEKGRFVYPSSGRDGVLLEADAKEIIKNLR